MMNILLLDLGREMRGGQWQVSYLAKALARTPDFVPHLLTPRGSPLAQYAGTIEGLHVIPLRSHQDWHPANLYTLARCLSRMGTAIVHTHCAKSASLGAFLKIFHGKRMRLVHTRRVSYPLKKRWSTTKYTLADHVVGVSAEIAQNLALAIGAAAPIDVIHSGIDLARYTRRIPRTDGRIIFGMIGALTPQKGYDTFLQALAQLPPPPAFPVWEARIIGDGPLFQDIIDRARELGIADRLALLGRQDATKLLPSFDVLAVPSVDGEGSSGTIKEAWAVGLPLVCSDLPSNLELVTDTTNGLVFPARDHIALAQHLEAVATDQALATSLVNAGFHAAEKFSADQMIRKYYALYQTLVR